MAAQLFRMSYFAFESFAREKAKLVGGNGITILTCSGSALLS
jgi:hypothetical protein